MTGELQQIDEQIAIFEGAGFSFDDQDINGVTPLMLACKHNPDYAQEVILNKSIKLDLSITDKDGKKAIDYCGENKELASLLERRMEQDNIETRFSSFEIGERESLSIDVPSISVATDSATPDKFVPSASPSPNPNTKTQTLANVGNQEEGQAL